MTENHYCRKIRKWLKKENDSKELREKIALWLLTSLNEEGDSLIRSGKVADQAGVIKVLMVLDRKWKSINKRSQIFKDDGWSFYVWNKWKIPLMDMGGKNE